MPDRFLSKALEVPRPKWPSALEFGGHPSEKGGMSSSELLPSLFRDLALHDGALIRQFLDWPESERYHPTRTGSVSCRAHLRGPPLDSRQFVPTARGRGYDRPHRAGRIAPIQCIGERGRLPVYLPTVGRAKGPDGQGRISVPSRSIWLARCTLDWVARLSVAAPRDAHPRSALA